MSRSEWIYRVLLKAYPKRFRDRFGEQMVQCFEDQLRSAATFGAWLRLWAETVIDFVKNCPARYLDARVPRLGNHSVTSEARAAIFFARAEASSFRRSEITLEHLLLGVLREHRKIRLALGPAALQEIVREVEDSQHTARQIPPIEDLPLDESCRSVMRAAMESARRTGFPQVELRHLLEAILLQEGSLAARLLRRYNITPGRFS